MLQQIYSLQIILLSLNYVISFKYLFVQACFLLYYFDSFVTLKYKLYTYKKKIEKDNSKINLHQRPFLSNV